jgi:hypothetical protein
MENFGMFPNLPFELRLKIWKFTFPGPRNVGIQIRFKDFGFGGWMSRKRTPTPPVALQVCHESREEALKCYILSFGTSLHPPTVYYNYKIDTLCFGDGPDIHSLFPERKAGYHTSPSNYLLNLWHGTNYNPNRRNDSKAVQAENVRYVSLDVDESIYGRPAFCWEEVRRFDGLEELLVLTWDAEDRADDLMSYFQTAMNVVAEAHPDWVVPNTEVVSALSGRNWGSLKPGRVEELA